MFLAERGLCPVCQWDEVVQEAVCTGTADLVVLALAVRVHGAAAVFQALLKLGHGHQHMLHLGPQLEGIGVGARPFAL